MSDKNQESRIKIYFPNHTYCRLHNTTSTAYGSRGRVREQQSTPIFSAKSDPDSVKLAELIGIPTELDIFESQPWASTKPDTLESQPSVSTEPDTLVFQPLPSTGRGIIKAC